MWECHVSIFHMDRGRKYNAKGCKKRATFTAFYTANSIAATLGDFFIAEVPEPMYWLRERQFSVSVLLPWTYYVRKYNEESGWSSRSSLTAFNSALRLAPSETTEVTVHFHTKIVIVVLPFSKNKLTGKCKSRQTIQQKKKNAGLDCHFYLILKRAPGCAEWEHTDHNFFCGRERSQLNIKLTSLQ